MERGRKGSKLCNPLCCPTQVKSILSLQPPPPHVFPPLSFVIVCYYRHYENCYYSDCLDTRIAVGGDGTLGSVDVYSFNCSGKHKPFLAVPQHGPLERRGKWKGREFLTIFAACAYFFHCEKPRPHIVCHSIHYQSCCWRSRFQEIKANRIFSNDRAQCGNGNDCRKAYALELRSSSQLKSSTFYTQFLSQSTRSKRHTLTLSKPYCCSTRNGLMNVMKSWNKVWRQHVFFFY